MMRLFIVALLGISLFTSCGKDKYTTAPQITYKSVDPNYSEIALGSVSPVIKLTVTDGDGDLGITADDTARIYFKNLLTGKSDSLDFPDLENSTKKNFKAEILVSMDDVIECGPGPSGHIDTIRYEVYIKDFGKHQSNTIVSDPTYLKCN